MQLETILNHVEKFKSFVYKSSRLVKTGSTAEIEVDIVERSNGQIYCSGCGCAADRCYDRLPVRRYSYIPILGIAVSFLYAARRVNCRTCGVRVELLPWSDGKHPMTTSYRWFLSKWAQRLSWSEVSSIYCTSWNSVYRSVQMAVEWGLKHREMKGIRSIGVDEIQWKRGHKYLTLAYQIDAGMKRLLWVGQDRTEQSLTGFFEMLGRRKSRGIRFVSSDMWQAYLTVVKQWAPKAVHVLDRFHIMKKFGEAIDNVRSEESRELKKDGYEPILKHTRWCLLKRPDNLTTNQVTKLEELLKYNLRSVRAYLMRDDFQQFWESRTVESAGVFLDDWCTRTMKSRLEPMKKIAKTIRRHRDLILNWFEAEGKISSGSVEGFNNKAKLTMRKAYGFRTPKAIEIALFHTLGNLPEPISNHRFC